MQNGNDALSYGKIFRFWVPLAATWLMMAAEGPFLAAIIARLPEPKFNLAAYNVAFSLALIVEAPIIMMMSASTALVKDWASYLKLRNFTTTLNAAITVFMLVLLIPPVFRGVAQGLIGLPPEVARLTHVAVALLLPWPGVIGYRRFYQGILIRNHRTRWVAAGTVIRLSTMTTTALLLYQFTGVDGVMVGAAALSAGVTCEALVSRAMVHRILETMRRDHRSETAEPPPSYRAIAEFYYPLALTSIIALGSQPIATFFMGQSRHALESLAVFPVVNSLVFLFRSLGLSYQEVVIALMNNHPRSYRRLRNFALLLGLGVVGSLALIALTPAADFWFERVSGLTGELSAFAHLPTQIMSLMPGLTVLLAFQRALLMTARHTRPITAATVLELTGIVITLLLTIQVYEMVGITGAAIAFVVGRLLANLFLTVPLRGVPGKITEAPPNTGEQREG